MLSSALTSKGQVTIPAQIRLKLRLHPGDKVGFMLEDDHVVLVRKTNDVRAAFGLHRARHSVSLEDMEKAISKRGNDDRD
jgi:antitoxin PrlF